MLPENPAVPAPIRQLLEQLDVTDMLTDYIPRARITRLVSWIDFELFLKEHGYCAELEGNNVYGRIKLAQIAQVPAFRVVTRSDVAAVYGRR